MTNAAGSVVWAADYLPFGLADVTVEIVENNLRLAGQYYDAETGLHYNYHRYYDPKLGRYLRADPIGIEGGINLYAYVQNNPVNYFDPYGLLLDSTGQYTGVAVAAGEATILAESALAGSALGTAALYTGGVAVAFSAGYFGTKALIKDTWLGEGLVGEWVYDLFHDSPTFDPCAGRKKWQPNKPNRKKQGREPSEKKRQPGRKGKRGSL